MEYLTLVRTGEQKLVLLRGLTRQETYARHDDRFYLTHIQLCSGAGAMLHYEHRHHDRPVLSDINTYQDDDPTKVHLQLDTLLDEHGHIQGLWQVVDGTPLRQLVRYNDDRLSVEYSYDALGRRLHKHSTAHYWNKPEAGTGWNEMQRAKRQRELHCGFTLYGWDGETLAWESSPPLDEGETGRTVHYLYEPGSFVPVAQAVHQSPVRLLRQPDWTGREYDFDSDPLWHTEIKPQGFDALAWYHCDHLGTPQELTDEQGDVVWAAQYMAWGEVREERTEWAKQQGIGNPIRFQGQYQDPETALHYNRHRYYEPKMARYVSRDPIGIRGGMNVYSYVSNTPVMRADPLGLWDAPFANMPGLQERASLGTHMMNNGESPEAIAKAMAPPPAKPVMTGECKASITIAAGVGVSGSVAINEKTGMSRWGSFQTSTIANRVSASCGLKFSSAEAKPLPAAFGTAIGVGVLNIELTQTSTWPDLYIGVGPGVGYEVKSPLNPSINFQ